MVLAGCAGIATAILVFCAIIRLRLPIVLHIFCLRCFTPSTQIAISGTDSAPVTVSNVHLSQQCTIKTLNNSSSSNKPTNNSLTRQKTSSSRCKGVLIGGQCFSPDSGNSKGNLTFDQLDITCCESVTQCCWTNNVVSVQCTCVVNVRGRCVIGNATFPVTHLWKYHWRTSGRNIPCKIAPVGCFFQGLHEIGVRNAFESRWMNHLVANFYGFLALGLPVHYRYYRWAYHRHTGDSKKDPELDDTSFLTIDVTKLLMCYALYASTIPFWIGAFTSLFRRARVGCLRYGAKFGLVQNEIARIHCKTRMTEPYLMTEKTKREVTKEAFLYALGYSLVMLLFLLPVVSGPSLTISPATRAGPATFIPMIACAGHGSGFAVTAAGGLGTAGRELGDSEILCW